MPRCDDDETAKSASRRLFAHLSRTVTLNVPVSLFPPRLVAVQATSVSPSGKADPDAGVHVTGNGPSTGSVAVAVNVTTAADEPVTSTLTWPGTFTFGGFLCGTVT